MGRTLRKTELFEKLTNVELIEKKTGTAGSTTLTAATAVGATSFPVAGVTNFAAADIAFLDVGEQQEVLTLATAGASPITSSLGAIYAHDNGQTLIEAQLTRLGHIGADGINWQNGGQFVEVNSAIRRLSLAYMLGYTSMKVTIPLEGFNVWNLALAMGIPAANIVGTLGDVTDPFRVLLGADDLDTIQDVALRMTGALKDGSVIQLELWGVQFDPTQVAFALKRGEVTTIPLTAVVTSGACFKQWR